MIRATVLYPKSAESHFNMDYYLNKHTPMVKERLTPFGMTSIDVDEGLAGFPPDQPATYHVICHLNFSTVEELQNGMGTHGAEIMGDIPNYTNVQPVVQINRVAMSL